MAPRKRTYKTRKPIQKVSGARWEKDAKANAKEVILRMTKKVSALSVVLEAAGVPVKTFYTWRGEDPKFDEDYRACQKISVERLEEEAMRRATEGGVKWTYDKEGNVIAEEIKMSDSLLLAALKAKSPEWREAVVNKTTLNVRGSDEHPITLKLTGKGHGETE